MTEESNLTIENTDDLKVIYVHEVGKDSDGLNVYHFMFTDNPDDVYGDDWGEKPACICKDLMPSEDDYQYVKELRTEMRLDLAQKNCCYTFQDCKDHCVALASENMDDYEEYPTPVRVVVQYGDSMTDVERMLGSRDMRLLYV